jgi:hypothetical protein
MTGRANLNRARSVADLKVLDRIDGDPGVMLVATSHTGTSAAVYLDPRTAMTLADKITILAEKWMHEEAQAA